MKQTALTKQDLSGEERSHSTLHEALAALERRLHGKANLLDRKRCSINDYTHWKARGSQEALRQTAKHMREMRYAYRSSRALYPALGGYLHCLEKSCGDAREESHRPVPKRGVPVVQWKAEGECLVLPGICQAIAAILAHSPLNKEEQRISFLPSPTVEVLRFLDGTGLLRSPGIARR